MLLFLTTKIAAVTSRAKLAPVVQKLDIAIRGGGGGGGGGGQSSFTQPYSYPYSDFFFKCPLRCSLAQANLFAIFMVASVSVIDLWQCISRQLFRRSCFMVLLRYSSWVVWGQRMCALKSPMSHVLSIIPLQVFFGLWQVWKKIPCIRRMCCLQNEIFDNY